MPKPKTSSAGCSIAGRRALPVVAINYSGKTSAKVFRKTELI
jgi:hypothetical protein